MSKHPGDLIFENNGFKVVRRTRRTVFLTLGESRYQLKITNTKKGYASEIRDSENTIEKIEFPDLKMLLAMSLAEIRKLLIFKQTELESKRLEIESNEKKIKEERERVEENLKQLFE